MNKTLFILGLTFFLLIDKSQAQSKEITIEFKGNCGLYLTDGENHIYTDFPYKSGAYNYMEYDMTTLDSLKENSHFIFTHKHADHYSKKLLKTILKQKNGQKYGVENIKELEQLSNVIDDFEIRAFKSPHKVFGISFKHYSYLIIWHGQRIFLSGDTTDTSVIAGMEHLDWAFVPYWILQNAKDQDIEIDTKMFGMYHLYPQQVPSAKENYDTVKNIRPMVEIGEKITLKTE